MITSHLGLKTHELALGGKGPSRRNSEGERWGKNKGKF